MFHYFDGLAKFQTQGKWGFVDTTGNVIVKPIYDYVGNFINGRANIEINGKQGYINKKGTVVIKQKFDPFRLYASFVQVDK